MFPAINNTRLVRALVVALAGSALLAPAAQAAGKPDAGDRQTLAPASVDLRSPDRKHPARVWAQSDAGDRSARVGGAAATDSRQLVDFRSADTRDAVYARYPEGSPVLVSIPGGFDWGDAMFGAAATFGALMLGAMTIVALRSRRRIALS